MLPPLIVEPGPMAARWVGGLAGIALGLVLLRPACDWPAPPASPPAPTRATSTPCANRAGELRRITVSSSVYGALVPVSVYLPPCYAASRDRLPVVYLLHGGNADETQWPDVGVASEADALIAQDGTQFVVVMPGGDYHPSLDYAAFVINDLLPGVEGQFHVSAVRADRAIGGISLGGYWALRVAFKHPELFAAVGGHSPVVNVGQHDDPLGLAATANGLEQLQVRLDVGDADALRAGTARFAQVLEARGLAVAFAVHPGRHDRVYWRSQTGAYLRFYLEAIADSSSTRMPGIAWYSKC
jgi:enterochelin esterase-like enzyme